MHELNETLRWFELAVPSPADKNKSTQVGCFFEEVQEVIEALEGEVGYTTVTELAYDYKTGVDTQLTDEQRIELLDGLCDVIVTAVGVAHMFGMDIIGAMNEVNRSNFSKFVDGKPVFNEQGKIAKPSTYSKPELEKFV
jgi:predicted HAD superfamily Cof-like phosphohydrolase